MAARDDDQVAGVADGELWKNFLVFFGEDFVGFGKPLGLAKASRLSTMTVAKPARVAIFEMLFEMWPAPKT